MISIVLAAATAASATAHAAATSAAANVPAPQVQAPPPPLPVLVQTPIAQHAPWLTHGLAGIFMIAAVALVILLALQTTKQEGLTGSIGGRVEFDVSRASRRRRTVKAGNRGSRGRLRRHRVHPVPHRHMTKRPRCRFST